METMSSLKKDDTVVDMHMQPEWAKKGSYINTIIGRKYVVGILCFFALVVSYIDRVNITVAIIPMSKEFGWNETVEGVIKASFFFGYVFSQIPGGYIADRIGGKKVLDIAVLWWSLCTLVTPLFTQNIYALVFARALLGLGEGVGFPAVMTVVSQWFYPHERTFVSSVITAGGPAGAVIAQLIIPYIVKLYGWEASFYFGALVGLTWLLLNVPFANDPKDSELLSSPFSSTPSPLDSPTPTPPHPPSSTPILTPTTPSKMFLAAHTHVRSRSVDLDNNAKPRENEIKDQVWSFVLRHPAAWALYVVSFAHGWLWWNTVFWFPTYLHKVFSAELAVVGFYSTFPVVAFSVSSSFFAWQSERLLLRGFSLRMVRLVYNTIGAVGCGVFYYALIYTSSMHMAVILITLAWIFGGCLKCGALVNHLDIAPKYAGTVFGVVNTFSNIPGVIGLLFAGYIVEQTGNWTLVFGLPSVLSVLSALVYLKYAEVTVLLG